MATQTNNWQEYFTRVNRFLECNICNIIYSRYHCPIHLYISHNIIDQKVILQWNNDNHLIWQHFSKTDLFCAKCKICGNLINSAYHKQNLDIHLRVVHKQEIAAIREKITRSWVSSHFTFVHKNQKINCIHCFYSGKIYDGVSILENHLKKVHDLDEHFVRRIEKELDYLEATMQCTTEENNVATSSQDGNIH